MGLFAVSDEKKRAKEIRKEGKVLRKDLLKAGLEKKMVDVFLEEYLASLERACMEQQNYKDARLHMQSCISCINEMLPQMSGLAADVCKTRLKGMLTELSQVYHDCLIRRDDMDYQSTYEYMKRTIPGYTDASRLMMQSELENLRAVFEDALEWDSPEFVALAYYLRHERSETLSEMENSQRNNYMENYFKEKFWDENSEIIEKAYMLERVLQFENEMLAK